MIAYLLSKAVAMAKVLARKAWASVGRSFGLADGHRSFDQNVDVLGWRPVRVKNIPVLERQDLGELRDQRHL
jgi:hypothetical protein